MGLIERYGRREFGGLLVNKTDGGEGVSGHIKSRESVERSAAAHRGMKRSPEARAKVSAGLRGKKRTPETRARMSAAKRNMSAETRAKIGAANRGKTLTQETRTKISASAIGREHAEETLAKISVSARCRKPDGFKGVSFREEERKWRAQIKIAGRRRHLGLHATPEGAARAYDAAAFAAWGSECYLNFPANDNQERAA